MFTEETAQHHPAQETHYNTAEPTMDAVVLESPASITPQTFKVGEEVNASQTASDTADISDDVGDATASQVQPTPITPTPTVETDTATPLIDHRRRDELTDLFVDTVYNPRFWARETRVQALIDALYIPVFDDKSLQQFFNHAMDYLTTEAAKTSSKEGKPAVLPTEKEGKVLAWTRYIEQARKKITMQLKKEGKPVTEDAIQTLLDAHLATLSDKQD